MQRPFRFAPPAPPPTAVLRPRLLESLSRRFDLRLVTVEAGAGFGKTTLLAQAVAENRLARAGRDVWLTCQPADSSPSSLLGAVLEAMGVEAPAGPASVADVCEAVWAEAPTHVCLVLDDAHLLDDATALQALLDELPANGHLVVAARRLPGVAVARLRVQHRAVHLAGDDLALADAELDELADRLGAPADVVRGSEGWAALAELRARLGTADARRFAWEEVVAPLPPAERDAFLVLVATGGATADALAEVVGPVDVTRLAALPLVATDDAGGLRPHPLWEDLVADHLAPDAVATARRSMADALAARGEPAEAFELAASAGDWPRALTLLFDACNDQRRPPWGDEMARWAGLVPPELAAEPEAVFLGAMVERAHDAWSPTLVAAFDRAIAGFRARGDGWRELMAIIRASPVAWVRADVAVQDAAHARGCELVDQGWPIEQILALNRAVVADIEGRSADAVASVAGLDALEPRLAHFPPLIRVFAALADGDAERARVDADATAALARPIWSAAGTGWSTLAPVLVRWASGELVEPPDDPGPRQSIAERIPAMALGIVVTAHLGRIDEARKRLAAMDALVPEVGGRDLLAGFRAVAGAAVAVAQGDEPDLSLLDGSALGAATAGRALRWFPALPYLFHAPSRAAIAALPSGPGRQRVLDACDALLAGTGSPALLDDPSALLAALPIGLACELAVRAGRPATVAGLAAIAPGPTRDALHRLGDPAKAVLASVPIPPDHAVRIEVLGPARLLVDGEPTADANWRRQRVRQLVATLVAHRELRRERLGVLLWPEFDDAGVSANLRMTLSYVQGLLEPGRRKGHAPWFLQQDAGLLRLVGGDRLAVDLWELEDHLDAAAGATPSVELDRLLQAVALWRGDPLDDVAGEEWADPVRERLRSRFVSASVRAGDLLVASDRAGEAVALADGALAVDRWSVAAHELLARAHRAQGDEDAARRATEAAARRSAELG